MSGFPTGTAPSPRPNSVAANFNSELTELSRRVREVRMRLDVLADDAVGREDAPPSRLTGPGTVSPVATYTGSHLEELRTEVSILEAIAGRLFI